MGEHKNRIDAAAAFLRRRSSRQPAVGLLTGTGLGGCADHMIVEQAIDYGDIPHFPVSTVAGHRGRLLLGQLHHQAVMVFQGRFHLYEGYAPREVVFPVRIMQALGAGTLIVTNAAGGLNPEFHPGDIMRMADHINLTGENPLVGPNEPAWGIRFPDMSSVYDPVLGERAHATARNQGWRLKRGVYAGLKGPSLETPAEIRFLTSIGADAVGLSTIQEVIAAVHAGMRILGLSVITNVNHPDRPVPATLEEIISVADQAAPRLARLIEDLLEFPDG
ncbi:MAG: purine-nucleoside phosphorylase [Desulfobacterales bacterium]|jgi:purine-nucleoside phosphorylase